MKKTYFSSKHVFAFMLLLAVFVYSCRKESTPKTVNTEQNPSKTLSVANAKAYLDSSLKTNSTTIKLSSTESNSIPAAFNGYLFWDKAKAFLNHKFEVVEVPVALDYRKINFYKLGGDTSIYLTDKSVAEAAFTRVLIYRDSSNKIVDKRIITYIPDKSYLTLNPNPSDNNWINSIDKGYSGYIEYRTWENVVYKVLRLVKGKVIASYNITLLRSNSTNLKTEGLKTNNISCGSASVPDMVTVCAAGSCDTHFNGTYSDVEVCADSGIDEYQSPFPIAWGDPGGAGGSGNNGPVTPTVSDADIANAIPVNDGKLPIDPMKFINCFTDGKTASQYKLTIYIAQPTPASNDWWSLDGYGEKFTSANGINFDVGHAFVGFQKINTDGTSVTQVMGFYPGAYNNTQPKGVIKDDGGHGYTVSYTVNVSASDFNSALNILSYENAHSDYALTNVNSSEFNCVDAALTWTLAGGISLPTSAPRGIFKNTPGDYGQALRKVSGVNTNSGYAPSSHGECN